MVVPAAAVPLASVDEARSAMAVMTGGFGPGAVGTTLAVLMAEADAVPGASSVKVTVTVSYPALA